MGQQHFTLLGIVLSHWDDFQWQVCNLSLGVKKKKLQTLCSSEWPTFEVGWPLEGTTDLPVVLAIQQRVFRAESATHLDQVPYIVVWRDLLTDLPSWIWGFLPNRILVLQVQTVPPAEPDKKIFSRIHRQKTSSWIPLLCTPLPLPLVLPRYPRRRMPCLSHSCWPFTPHFHHLRGIQVPPWAPGARGPPLQR